MKEKTTKMWIPLYVDKWIFGSTRIEMEPAERGVFIDLMVLAAKDSGFIRANETTPYLPVQIAGILNIPKELLASTIAKCLEFGKFSEPSPGIYRFCKWDDYQFTDRYVRKVNENGGAVPKKRNTCSGKEATIEQDRIGKNNIGQDSGPGLIPTLAEVREYCLSTGAPVDPVRFWTHYQGTGWKVGNSPIKDWKALLTKWTTTQAAEPVDRQPSPSSAPKMAYEAAAPHIDYSDPKGWEKL